MGALTYSSLHRRQNPTHIFAADKTMQTDEDAWIPALDGIVEKRQAGARVADIGCGHGASMILLAQAYPNSTIIGFDYHAESIEAAQQRAIEAGVAGCTQFEVASAETYKAARTIW